MARSVALAQIPSFDATNDINIQFFVTGDQSVSSELIIYKNSDNSIIFQDRIISFRTEFPLPAGSLQNGIDYYCTITVYNANDEDITSSPMNFKTLTTPIWRFLDLTEDQIIRSNTIRVTLEYFQEQNESLDTYEIFVFDGNQHQIFKSGVRNIFDSQFEFAGLLNNETYFIRAVGRTISGFLLDTNFVRFSAIFDNLMLNQLLYLENMEQQSAVKVSSRIVVITGKSNPAPPKFIDDKIVDLQQLDNYVRFDEGFSVDSDFIIELIGFGFKQNEPILQLSDRHNTMTLFWRHGDFPNENGNIQMRTFAELRVNPIPIYVTFSNHLVNVTDNDLLHVWIRRLNSLYEVRIHNMNEAAVNIWNDLKIWDDKDIWRDHK